MSVIGTQAPVVLEPASQAFADATSAPPFLYQLTPAEAANEIPLLDPSTILGAYHVPTDGIAKAVTIATALARTGEANGVAFEGGVTVTGFDVRDGRVHGVRTDRGNVECERVLLCSGIWGPTVGAMAGVAIPLVAVQHQLVWTDPVAGL